MINLYRSPTRLLTYLANNPFAYYSTYRLIISSSWYTNGCINVATRKITSVCYMSIRTYRKGCIMWRGKITHPSKHFPVSSFFRVLCLYVRFHFNTQSYNLLYTVYFQFTAKWRNLFLPLQQNLLLLTCITFLVHRQVTTECN